MTKQVSAEDVRDAVAWLARHAKGMTMEGWQDVSATLLAAAETISALRADAERWNGRPDEPRRMTRAEADAMDRAFWRSVEIIDDLAASKAPFDFGPSAEPESKS